MLLASRSARLRSLFRPAAAAILATALLTAAASSAVAAPAPTAARLHGAAALVRGGHHERHRWVPRLAVAGQERLCARPQRAGHDCRRDHAPQRHQRTGSPRVRRHQFGDEDVQQDLHARAADDVLHRLQVARCEYRRTRIRLRLAQLVGAPGLWPTGPRERSDVRQLRPGLLGHHVPVLRLSDLERHVQRDQFDAVPQQGVGRFGLCRVRQPFGADARRLEQQWHDRLRPQPLAGFRGSVLHRSALVDPA